MRNLLLLLVAVSLFSACKKETISNPSFANDLIGTWNLHEAHSATNNGQTSIIEIDYTIIFTNDGHYTLKQTGQPDKYCLWSVSADEQTFLSSRESTTPTFYFTEVYDILDHSATYNRFNRSYISPYITTTGDTLDIDISVDWVLTK